MEDQHPSSSRDQVLGSAALVAHIARFIEGTIGANNFARVCKAWATVVWCTAQRFNVKLDTQASAEGAAAALNRAYAAHPDGAGRTAHLALELIDSSAVAAHFFQALSDRARQAVVGLECICFEGVYPAGHPPPHQLLPKLQSLTYLGQWCWKSLHIADLPHLTSLTVGACALQALTLGANLTQLKALYCSSNELTTLNLSSVPQLAHLDARGNQLTALDLSSVPQLSFLDVGDNQLTVLNLSSVPRITTLYCTRNKLSELNVEGLQVLKLVSCKGNRNVTSVTLASAYLQWVACSGCALTQLTIRDATVLKWVRYSCQGEFHLTLPTPAPVGARVDQIPFDD